MSEEPVPKHFNSDLIDSGIRSDFKSLEDNPEKIVRYESLEGTTLDRQIKRHSEGKKILERLRGEYNLAIPNVDSFVGYNSVDGYGKGKSSMVIVTDRVHGSNLADIEYDPNQIETVWNDHEEFFANLLRYFIQAFQKKDNFIGDLKSAQFVYGTREGETKKRIYQVDIEPFFRPHDPNNVQNHFFHELVSIETMMTVAEKKMSGGEPYDVKTFREFTELRKIFRDFIKALPSDIQKLPNVRELQNSLSHDKEKRVSQINEKNKRQKEQTKNNPFGWRLIETY